MKRYSYAMDMVKAVLALLVIAIHVNPLGESGGGGNLSTGENSGANVFYN